MVDIVSHTTNTCLPSNFTSVSNSGELGFIGAVCPCHSVRLESRGRAGVKGASSFMTSPSASDAAEMRNIC